MNPRISSLRVLAFACMIFMGTPPLKAQTPQFPYPYTTYDEPYRAQFHFSPQCGWMNDVNGIWYHKGVYYMTYQHYPHGLIWDQIHWGAATSRDMMHWMQEPIALDPDVNVPGYCFSGSVVVDEANTSGLKTGTEDVFVAIYTATKKGTCLAYSNDRGKTWLAYTGNPIAIGKTDQTTRDPHIAWHAPSNRWVCAEYENGTTFYTSPDLKNWTKQSTLNFGKECPDLFELAVDDCAGKKWVVMDASSMYLIGGFDGAVFTPDTGGPWKMDLCPDFYASQTFFRNNFPDNRVIQMAWMRGTLGTSFWTHEASFPCEIRLRRFAYGARATRFPVAEVCSLYASTRHWDSQQLSPGDNLLSAVHSKCFDLSAEFDLAGATATVIAFELPNKTVTYDIPNATLLGKPLRPVNNKVKIRLLVDWGELEAFGNDGEFSWTQNVKFTPSDSAVGLSVNGGVGLVAMDFHTIKRTWEIPPPTPDFTTNLTGAWTPLGGAWTDVAAGKQGRGADSAFCLNSRVDSNFTYEGDIMLPIGTAGALVFRANADASEGYCVSIASSGFIQLWTPRRGRLAYSMAYIQNGPTPYHVKVVALGGAIKVYFNNGSAPVIDYTDTIPHLSGRFGLNVCKGIAVFQNVIVSDVAAGLAGNEPVSAKEVTVSIKKNFGAAGRLRIDYRIPQGMSPVVTLEVFNLRGRLVRRLVNGITDPGDHTIGFGEESGGPLTPGNYFLRLRVKASETISERIAGIIIGP